MIIENNTALVRRPVEALNRGIVVVNALRPDAFALHEVSHFAGHPLDYTAHAGFDAMLLRAFPDLQFTLEDLFADRDQVVARFRARGTQTGVFQGIPATGRAAVVSGIAIYRLADGKVMEQWLEYDQLGLLQQLGVIPAIG